MDGIVIINKPAGMTSFGVIARMRKIFEMKKIGHAGTLDPDATGVLPVCLGKATRVIEFMMEKDKAYHVVMKLGVVTDTQDASGKVLSVNRVGAEDEQITKVINSFVGNIMQIPPMYSAIRIGGERLYEMARRGCEIARDARPVSIIAIEGISIARSEGDVRATFDVECSKGTYIRTLCNDIGARLGCGGHMESLVRTRSGRFLLKDAFTLEDLEAKKKDGTLQNLILGMETALVGLPSCAVSEDEKRKLRNGLTIRCLCSAVKPGDLVRIHGDGLEFLAIGKALGDGSELMLKSHKWLEGT